MCLWISNILHYCHLFIYHLRTTDISIIQSSFKSNHNPVQPNTNPSETAKPHSQRKLAKSSEYLSHKQNQKKKIQRNWDKETYRLVRMLRFQVKQLSNNERSGVIRDRAVNANNALLQEPGKDIVSSLPARRLLDDHGHQAIATPKLRQGWNHLSLPEAASLHSGCRGPPEPPRPSHPRWWDASPGSIVLPPSLLPHTPPPPLRQEIRRGPPLDGKRNGASRLHAKVHYPVRRVGAGVQLRDAMAMVSHTYGDGDGVWVQKGHGNPRE